MSDTITSDDRSVAAVVIIGGGPLSPRGVAGLRADATRYAADSGYDHALDVGLEPHVLVGDLDSISVAGLAAAHARGVEIVEHPPDKDLTDTELALDLAVARGAERITLIGGSGDRLDHLLGTISALGRDALAGCTQVEAWLGDDHVHVAHPGRVVHLDDPVDTTFSVLALHGPCTGVSIVGGAWPLVEASLPAGSARGVSNVVTGPCSVSCGTGVLTVVVPS